MKLRGAYRLRRPPEINRVLMKEVCGIRVQVGETIALKVSKENVGGSSHPHLSPGYSRAGAAGNIR